MAPSSSGSRPLLRTGGIALLGIGVIAATVGLFTSVTAGPGPGTAVPSASSQALAPTAASAAPAPAPPVPSAPPETAPQAAPPAASPAPSAAPDVIAPVPVPSGPAPAERPAPPAVAAPPAPGAAGDGAGGVRAPVRVYNNSLIQGLAARAKSDFEARGWDVTDISGYGSGVISHSTVYFRPGTGEETAAQELGREFGLRVEPRFPGIAQSSGGVIVIVTEDYKPAGRS